MSRLIGFFGAGVIAAGVFVADPAAGYPVGVPAGLSWHGVLHGVAAAVSGLAAGGRRGDPGPQVVRRGQRRWAAAAALASLAFVVLPFTASDQFGLMFALASVIGWGMLSVITGR